MAQNKFKYAEVAVARCEIIELARGSSASSCSGCSPLATRGPGSGHARTAPNEPRGARDSCAIDRRAAIGGVVLGGISVGARVRKAEVADWVRDFEPFVANVNS